MNNRRGQLWMKWWEERSRSVYEWEDELQLIRSELTGRDVRRVLSLGCGAGPYIRKLAECGIEGVGVDRDPELIDLARSLAKGRDHLLRFVEADIRNLPSLGVFDAVLAMHMTFAPEDWRTILRGLRSVLRPGGLFVGGFVFSPEAPIEGRRGATAHILDLGREDSLIEVDAYVIGNDRYRCAMFLIEDGAGGLECEREATDIFYFASMSAVRELLDSEGLTDTIVLREEGIGFPGLTAALVRGSLAAS